MTCEEFHIITSPGPGAKMPSQMTRAERAAVIEHAMFCNSCTADLMQRSQARLEEVRAIDPALVEPYQNTISQTVKRILEDDYKDPEFIPTILGEKSP